LSADLTRPFGPAAAARSDLMRLCRRWPTASAAPPPEPGAMPDVPVLVVGATGQIATPLETARRTARRFARAQLLVTQDVFGASLTGVSGCLVRALERFMRDRDAAGRCGAKGPPLRPGLPVPRSVDRLRAVRDVPGRRGRVLHAFELTLSEWYGDIYAALVNGPAAFLERSELRGGGLRGGRWALGRDQVVLDRYEFIPGVRISLAERASAKHVSVTVDGPGRLDGRLAVSGTDDDDDLEYVVRGHLGGQRIRARLRLQSRLLDAISVGSVASATP
jgi:hypothetical protein